MKNRILNFLSSLIFFCLIISIFMVEPVFVFAQPTVPIQPINIAIPQQIADLPTGTTSELIIQAYGEPMVIIDIPNSNQEIWSYPDKNIIFKENIVELIDRSPDHRFQEGSSRVELILAQGFPDKIFYVDALKQELWHYSTAFVVLKEDKVIEWTDHSNILNLVTAKLTDVNALKMGQTKEQIIQIIGNPHSIQQLPTLNETIWHYETNFLTFRDGKLRSFDQQQDDAALLRGVFKNDGNPETTDSLMEIATNLGILSSTNTVQSSTTAERMGGIVRGVFKNDGLASTNEQLNVVSQKVADPTEEWVQNHAGVFQEQNVVHFFGYNFSKQKNDSIPDDYGRVVHQVKAATNVTQFFGYNFFH